MENVSEKQTAPTTKNRMLSRLWKNKRALIGFWMVVVFVVAALFAPILSPYNPIEQNMDAILQLPSAAHWFGTDEYGRDILSRILHGASLSLMIGLGGVCISLVIGVSVGTLAGYFGGAIDATLMRLTDILLAFPAFLLAIAIVAALGPGMVNVTIAIGVFSLPSFTRLSRGAVLSVKNREYIEAARSMGARNTQIIFKHILPNSMAPIVVLATLRIATAILSASGLSFLGLGAQPPTPEWGSMLATGREHLRSAPFVCIIPGLAIMYVVLAFNMLGDGLRDAFDTRMKV